MYCMGSILKPWDLYKLIMSLISWCVFLVDPPPSNIVCLEGRIVSFLRPYWQADLNTDSFFEVVKSAEKRQGIKGARKCLFSLLKSGCKLHMHEDFWYCKSFLKFELMLVPKYVISHENFPNRILCTMQST